MQMYDWLLCYMLKISHTKLNANLKSGKDAFTILNYQNFHLYML
jgi:hypothetical protein